MKTKKISWQAIAIVVLALVLIASIALGVSGAWFQDKDSSTTEATLGKPVTIRLADTADTSKKPIRWEDIYTDVTKAFPGDKVLGATSLIPGSETPSVFRISISATATGTGYLESQKTAPDALDTDADEATVLAWNQKNDSFLINSMLDQTKLTGWSKSKVASSNWYYYDAVYSKTDAISLFNELKLSTEISNAAAEWKISIVINVEAIQAANLSENTDWSTDYAGLAIEGAVDTYNSDRLKPKA